MSGPVPLRRRMFTATLVVAIVAVVATTLVLLPLSRAVDVAAARGGLAAQAERIAAADPEARESLVANLSALDDATLVAVVSPAGDAAGSAAGLAVPRILLQLRAGRAVSTIVRGDGRGYLVEAVPTADGGGVLVAQDATTVRSVLPDFLRQLLLALGVGVVIALVAAIVAARTLVRPLVRVAASARRLAAGERELPNAPTGVRELDEVSQAVATLDRALARSEGRQREFLLSISHEIRTPLTALRGYAEALADGAIPPSEAAAVGRTMHDEALRLTAFTDDLLALARLEADDFRLEPADLDLGELLVGAAEAWRAAARARGVAIEVHVPSPVVVRADAVRLRQVVDGLIENAVRVSGDGTTVTISGRRDDGGVVVEVADQGPGITAEDAECAFERGRLRERYRDTRPVGTGLGLSIAARLVERMGGSISARPGDPGAVFRIRLAV